MSDRETDARRLAELAGWEWVPANEADTTSIPWDDSYGIAAFRVLIRGTGSHEIDGFAETADREDLIYVPFADARLSAHLAFVGELAEALGEKIGMDHSERLAWCSAVCADAADIPPGDLAHAAIRAAIAALEARR